MEVLLNFKFWKRENRPWQIDFRDNSIINDSRNAIVKSASIVVLTLLTVVLCVWACVSFVVLRSKKAQLEEVQHFMTTHTAKHKVAMDANREFLTIDERLKSWFKQYRTMFNIGEFWQDLCLNKPENIRYTKISINNNVSSENGNTASEPWRLSLFGEIKGDVSFLDKYNVDILNYPSLKGIRDKSRSFFRFDQNTSNYTNEEVKFNLTIEPNE